MRVTWGIMETKIEATTYLNPQSSSKLITKMSLFYILLGFMRGLGLRVLRVEMYL